MASTAYAFIDIAVLNPVRGRFAAGEALLLLEEDAEAVLWANAPGAALVGADDLIAAVGMSSGLTPTARRQIVSAPARGHATQIVTRIGGRPVSLSVQHVDLPRGGRGILLAAPDQSASDNALERAIAGFGDSGQYLAIVDHEATILAATDGLADMGLTPAALGQLVADVRLERDRLVKRRLQVEGRRLPVGFARLTDDPALHLLVVVDDGEASPAIQDAAAPAVETPVEQAGPDVGPDMEEAPDATPMSPGKTLRFLWRTDEQGRLNAISDEFLDATGIGADALIGRTFPQLSETLGIDRDGVIAALLDRRDTWSGRTVHWPVGAKSVPVDLAALPAYSRERAFEGFRGFGVARFGDATTLHLMAPLSAKPDGQAEVEAETAAPDETVDAEAVAPPIREDERPDTPAPEAAEEPAIGKVIHLADRRERSLSQAERSAFREIGDRLRSEE
ncbi:PAS domain-containing sensor histidine kinase, partial [Escherichia coli]|nr:PAS domain-containing sensor histidine kinase [Escherichia coli]